MSRLVPCEGCSRHARAEAERCPFCDAAIIARSPSGNSRGRSRAAVYAALITCASIGGACGQPQPSATPEGGGSPPNGPTPTGTTSTGATASAPAPLPPAAKHDKKEGDVCESDDACAVGMKCCITSVCGGRAAQAGLCPPQKSNCVVGAACPAIAMPPYGCVFPDACLAARTLV